MRASQNEHVAISTFLGDMKHARNTLAHLLSRAEASPTQVKLYLETLSPEMIRTDPLLHKLQRMVEPTDC